MWGTLRPPVTAAAALFALAAAPPRAAAAPVPLQLAGGWTQWGSGFAPAAASKVGDVVTVTGVLRGSGHGRVATLPPGLRPPARLVFALNNEHLTARVDVLPDGSIQWVKGGGTGWIALDGITFSVTPGQRLPLAAGWQDFGGGYGPLEAKRAGDLIVLSGLVRAPAARGPIATLPAGLRPPESLIFNAGNDDRIARVDVSPDGSIRWDDGGPIDPASPARWLSLSGITFSARAGRPLPLAAGWQSYGGFAPARVIELEGRVVVSGLIRGAAKGLLATLPPELRPAAGMIFHVNNADLPVRIDAGADGALRWTNGGRPDSWISLSGITFASHTPGGGASSTPQAGTPAPQSGGAAERALIAARQAFSGVPVIGPLLARVPASALRPEGTLFRAGAQIADQTVELVLYVPAGYAKPEVAVLTDDLAIGNLITELDGTQADQLRVTNAAFIFVPRENERNLVAVSALPGPIAAKLAHLTWRQIDLVAGGNVFGSVHASAGGEIADVLKAIGICGDAGAGCFTTLDVHGAKGTPAANACRAPDKKHRKQWSLRLMRPGRWEKPFGLDGVRMDGATLEIAEERGERILRAWAAQAAVRDKSYFLFAQCVTSSCKIRNAFAFSAKKVSLEDYQGLVAVLAGRVFGDSVADGLSGLDALPLHLVEVHHPNGYDPAANVDAATGDPKFDTMLGYMVGPGQRLPTNADTCLEGSRLYARGKGKVLSADVATLEVETWNERRSGSKAGRTKSGLYAEGEVLVPSWAPMASGGRFDFRVRRQPNAHEMVLSGGVDVAGVKAVAMDLAVTRERISATLPPSCPLRPFSIHAAAGLDLTKAGGLSLSTAADLDAGCLADFLEQIAAGAQAVAAVAAAHVPQALSAMGELGRAGIGVVETCAKEGWDEFDDEMEDAAKASGKKLSDGWNTAIDGAESSPANPANWL